MTHTEAQDQTYKVFLDALTAEATGIIGYIPEVRWKNVPKPGLPDITKFYIRAEFIVASAQQSAFGASIVGSRRLYANEGVAMFAIHTPQSVASGDRKAKLLAEKLKTAFRRPVPDCHVWFRRQRIQDTYPEDQFLRTNLLVDFYFTEDD